MLEVIIVKGLKEHVDMNYLAQDGNGIMSPFFKDRYSSSLGGNTPQLTLICSQTN